MRMDHFGENHVFDEISHWQEIFAIPVNESTEQFSN